MAGKNTDVGVVDIRTRNAYIITENAPLEVQERFGGGGGGGPMEPTVSMREYVDKADEAIETRLGAKFDRLPTKGALWGAVAAIVAGIFTAVAIVLASLSFASDRFNGGLSVSPVIAAQQAQQAKTDKDQDTKLQVLDDKLDIIIKQTASK